MIWGLCVHSHTEAVNAYHGGSKGGCRYKLLPAAESAPDGVLSCNSGKTGNCRQLLVRPLQKHLAAARPTPWATDDPGCLDGAGRRRGLSWWGVHHIARARRTLRNADPSRMRAGEGGSGAPELQIIFSLQLEKLRQWKEQHGAGSQRGACHFEKMIFLYSVISRRLLES